MHSINSIKLVIQTDVEIKKTRLPYQHTYNQLTILAVNLEGTPVAYITSNDSRQIIVL